MLKSHDRWPRPLAGIAVFVHFVIGQIVAGADPLFERDAQPIIQRSCVGCHGGLKREQGLDLRTIESGRTGGDSGPALVAGNPDKSLLWQQIVDDTMPPHDRKLTAAEKDVLKRWIAAGMPALADRPRSNDPLLTPGRRHEPLEVAAAVDSHVAAGLKAVGMEPTPVIGDEEFVRRVHLDLVGCVPTADKAAEFIASTASDKRVRLIDELLADAQFGTQFGRTWLTWIAPLELPANPSNGKTCASTAERFGHWIGNRVVAGDGWDRIVTEILTAVGPHSTTEVREVEEKGKTVKKEHTTYTPQGLFFSLAGSKDGHPMPGGTARSIGSLFMGVQLTCAECHDEPSRNWKQTDFWSMAAFFQHLSPVNGSNMLGISEHPFVRDESKATKAYRDARTDQEKQGQKWSPAQGQVIIPPSALKNAGTVVPAAFLGSGEAFRGPDEGSLRPHFAAWLTAKGNPFFARAFANRMWSYFFVRGIVHPVDDFRDLNPPSHPGLITLLANEFSDADFDVRHLLRCICNSATYQRSSRPPPGMAEPDVDALTAAFGRMPLRHMMPDAFYDSLRLVYGDKEFDLRRVAEGKDPALVGEGRTMQGPKEEFALLFPCDETDPTTPIRGVPARLALLNHQRVTGPCRPLQSQVKAAKPPEEIIEWLYLSTLSRRPEARERDAAVAYLTAVPGDYGGVLWSLVNRSEFHLIR